MQGRRQKLMNLLVLFYLLTYLLRQLSQAVSDQLELWVVLCILCICLFISFVTKYVCIFLQLVYAIHVVDL